MKLKFVHFFWFVAFTGVLALRVSLCAQAPIESSDLFRNLGYTSHLADLGLSLYDTVASRFSPEFWTQFWPTQGFIYPPAMLLFFSFFSTLGLGLFWVKFTFTILDLFLALLVAESFGAFSGLLLFSAPVSLWYTSHEGQFDGLLSLWIILAILALKKSRWFWAGFFWMVALNCKQFAVLFAPFILAEILREPKERRVERLRQLILGSVAGFLPFSVFYVISPDLWLKPFATQGFIYNPFYWNYFEHSRFSWNPNWLIVWNAIMTWIPVLLVFIFLLFSWSNSSVRKSKLIKSFEGLPLLSFFALLKKLNWAQFWYTMTVPAFIFCLHRYKKIVIALLIIHWLQCGRSLVELSGQNFGIQENPETISHFQSCLWTCNYKGLP